MPIFRVKSVEIYTGQKNFARTPSVASVTNIRYDYHYIQYHQMERWDQVLDHNWNQVSQLNPKPHQVNWRWKWRYEGWWQMAKPPKLSLVAFVLQQAPPWPPSLDSVGSRQTQESEHYHPYYHHYCLKDTRFWAFIIMITIFVFVNITLATT